MSIQSIAQPMNASERPQVSARQMETLQRANQASNPESSRIEAKQLLTLVVCCLAISVIVIDFTIVINALPSIQATFSGVSVKDLEWITSLYGPHLRIFSPDMGKTRRRVWKKTHPDVRHRHLRIGILYLRALGQSLADACRPI